jgi:ornithine carbamoyltransferase
MIHHFLTLQDHPAEVLESLLRRASELKGSRSAPKPGPLSGKALGLLFEKPSTRTRVSFEVATAQLGGTTVSLAAADLQLSRGETPADTARTLSRYLSGLVIRTYDQKTLDEWARYSTIPIINGLSDLHHPCQAMADLLTIREQFGALKGLRLAYIGDGNNVAHSLIEGGAKTGMTVVLACPKGFDPNPQIVQKARETADPTGGGIEILRDPLKAADGADVLYTDVWVSMGKERESKKRLARFKPYQINSRLLKQARPHAIVMHCLPAHRGLEITADVMDGPQSAVWDQAENRLHAQKAILEWLLT